MRDSERGLAIFDSSVKQRGRENGISSTTTLFLAIHVSFIDRIRRQVWRVSKCKEYPECSMSNLSLRKDSSA